MDAVEDILLDDFSLGDDSSDDEPDFSGKPRMRSDSIDSIATLSHKGKKIIS